MNMQENYIIPETLKYGKTRKSDQVLVTSIIKHFEILKISKTKYFSENLF